MDEEMNISEIAIKLAEENQTRKILEILDKCKSVEDYEAAIEKIRALINN